MTVADPTNAASIHFHQSSTGTHLIRPLPTEENKPLVTLNYRYSPDPTCDRHCSRERQEEINKFFRCPRDRSFEDVLALPFVNNLTTTHRIVMRPATKQVLVAFDNAFAGKIPLHEVPVKKLFKLEKNDEPSAAISQLLQKFSHPEGTKVGKSLNFLQSALDSRKGSGSR